MEANVAKQFASLPFIEDMLAHGMYKSTNPDTRTTAGWAAQEQARFK